MLLSTDQWTNKKGEVDRQIYLLTILSPMDNSKVTHGQLCQRSLEEAVCLRSSFGAPFLTGMAMHYMALLLIFSFLTSLSFFPHPHHIGLHFANKVLAPNPGRVCFLENLG